MPISRRMQGFMDRWSLRKCPAWRPGMEVVDKRVICVNCNELSWYDRDSMYAKFQLNGQYLCKECRVCNPIQLALCQSIPYEVLSIVMQVCPPRLVKDVMWK